MLEIDLAYNLQTVFEHEKLTSAEKIVLIYFHSHVNAFGECTASIRSLAQLCSLSRRQAGYAIDRLREMCLITGSRGFFKITQCAKYDPQLYTREPQCNTREPKCTNVEKKYRDRAAGNKKRIEVSEGDLQDLMQLLQDKDKHLLEEYERTGDREILNQIDRLADIGENIETFLRVRFKSVTTS